MKESFEMSKNEKRRSTKVGSSNENDKNGNLGNNVIPKRKRTRTIAMNHSSPDVVVKKNSKTDKTSKDKADKDIQQKQQKKAKETEETHSAKKEN